jgi:hypothetical protein
VELFTLFDSLTKARGFRGRGEQIPPGRFAPRRNDKDGGVGGMIRVRRLGRFRLASLRRDGRGARRHMVHDGP